MGTFRETLAKGNEGALHLGLERARVYSDLSPEDKDRYNAKIRATNILLQGLPKYIYTLINHYTDAKDIWDNVKMLLEGSELTKEDRESQLYDDFEHFHQNKGETIHEYYVRFTMLINDMRNIKMTMPRIQLNSKFVSNMLPEWGIFVIGVKLNKGLKESNYVQLYAYLKQHEVHANENKMMLERFTQHTADPLALMSNVLPQQTSLNIRNQATIQDGGDVVQNVQGRQNRGQGNNPRGSGAAGNGGAQNRVRNANPGQARQINVITAMQLLFLAGGHDTTVDEDVDESPIQDLALNVDKCFKLMNVMLLIRILTRLLLHRPCSWQICHQQIQFMMKPDAVCEHHDAHEMHHDVQPNCVVESNADYTSDSNMIPYDQYVKDNAEPVNKVVNASLTAELATYKEQVELHERRAKFELTEREQKIKEKLRIVITDHNIKEENLKKELHSVKIKLNSTINHNKSMVEEVTSLKEDFKQKENKYLEEFLDMKALKEKVEDKLYKQDQCRQTVHMLCKPRPYYDEQRKVSICYKNLLLHNSEDTLEIAEITMKKMNEIVHNSEEKKAKVDQNVVNRKYDEIERKNLLIANDNLITDCLSKEVFYIAINSELTVSRFTEMQDAHTVVQARCLDLEAELSKLHDKVQKHDHTELVKRFFNLEIMRAKHIEQTTALLTENENLKAQIHENMKRITMDSRKPRIHGPGRYAIDVEPIPPRNRNNKEVHLDYLKHLKESVETLCEIVKEAKVERPLDRSLASACLYTKHSQELLEYAIGTCPKDFNKRDKKHASTPLTRKKRVTFEDQCETSNRVNSCTDARESKPRSNTKKNRGVKFEDNLMSSPTHPTPSDVDEECAFPSANILDYTSTLTNYFPARSGNNSSDFSENSKNDEISPIFSPFYNNPYQKDMQVFNAKESPIPPLDHITPPAILTSSPVLPPSLLFDPRYFFVPEELLPPKKQIHAPSSSSTTISNSSRKQACILVPLSFSPYTPTPPQIYELGKSSFKMRVKHHEKHIESILNYLEELSFHYIEKIEERLVNG
ncbi:hypothetical protein Tco_0967822 [Tanacetum coccineum]